MPLTGMDRRLRLLVADRTTILFRRCVPFLCIASHDWICLCKRTIAFVVGTCMIGRAFIIYTCCDNDN